MSIFNQVFIYCARHRAKIIDAFKILYGVLALLLLFGSYSAFQVDSNYLFYYSLARKCGEMGILVYILTTIPGITKRFHIRSPLIQILMMFRRYLGILMFTLITIHFMILRGVGLFFQGTKLSHFLVFEIVGLTAYILLLSLFLTSNDWSIKRLGIWWDRLHQLTYIVVWLIFLHVALQRFDIWALLIGVTAIAQASSHVYVILRKRALQEAQNKV
jgi:DMSO/TMAO reductase YedYZ heme-binding membrane subunit